MKVSIVIPVYNEEKYLNACLKAVARQSRKPDEVIVVDNNCSDDTVDIAERYPFVRIVPEARQGIVFARNAGFRAAKGDILARLDADSRIPPDWVAKIVRAFDGSDLAVVTGRPRFYDIRLAWLFNVSQVLLYQYFQKLLTGTYVVWGANMAMRRRAWRDVAPFCSERLDIDEDIDLSFWLHKTGYRIRYMQNLSVKASFQRGRTGLRYTARYLSTWPRDYLLHRMYVRAFIVTLLVGLILIVSLPASLIRRFAPAG